MRAGGAATCPEGQDGCTQGHPQSPAATRTPHCPCSPTHLDGVSAPLIQSRFPGASPAEPWCALVRVSLPRRITGPQPSPDDAARGVPGRKMDRQVHPHGYAPSGPVVPCFARATPSHTTPICRRRCHEGTALSRAFGCRVGPPAPSLPLLHWHRPTHRQPDVLRSEHLRLRYLEFHSPGTALLVRDGRHRVSVGPK